MTDNKTAMQIFQERFAEWHSNYLMMSANVSDLFNIVFDKELLAKEKEQIMEAHEAGRSIGQLQIEEFGGEYYNTTYSNQ